MLTSLLWILNYDIFYARYIHFLSSTVRTFEVSYCSGSLDVQYQGKTEGNHFFSRLSLLKYSIRFRFTGIYLLLCLRTETTVQKKSLFRCCCQIEQRIQNMQVSVLQLPWKLLHLKSQCIGSKIYTNRVKWKILIEIIQIKRKKERKKDVKTERKDGKREGKRKKYRGRKKKYSFIFWPWSLPKLPQHNLGKLLIEFCGKCFLAWLIHIINSILNLLLHFGGGDLAKEDFWQPSIYLLTSS